MSESLATRLKQARAAAGLSQMELAKKAGISQATIGNLEAGIRGATVHLVEIALVLGVAPNWLKTGNLAQSSEQSAWPFESLSARRWSTLTERQRGRIEGAALAELRRIEAESKQEKGLQADLTTP